MKLFTKEQLTRLLRNGNPEHRSEDHIPVVKLFTPDAGCTWLLTEIDSEETDLAFGLCDLELGFPELGYVSITELISVCGCFGLPVERDRHFEGKYPVSVYTDAVYQKERIITENDSLFQLIATAIKKV
jgi:hypothetical protein